MIELRMLFAVLVVFTLPGCEPNSAAEVPSVLVVTLDSVHRVWPPMPPNLTDHNYSLSYGRGYVTTIDFNYHNKTFCYIQPRILFRLSDFKCASADNFNQTWELSKPTLFPSQFAVTTMAYDWASGDWYFIDKTQRCLYVCDGTLQHCRILHRNVEDPRGLAVDPTPPRHEGQTAGFVFLSQNNTTPSRLMRSDLSGGDVTGLLPQDCSGACNPKALTLDIVNKLIFWVDGETDTVEQSNYDGSARTTVYKINEAYNSNIKVFSKFMSTLYLPGYRSILTALLNSTETFTTVYGFPSTAAVYHGSRQPKVSHPCAKNNGGCEHICVTTYQGVTPIARCLCQHGFQLYATKHGACARVKLDTFMLVSRGTPPGVEVRESPLVDSVAAAPAASYRPTVADVDIQSEYIYFSDIYLNQIIRQKLDGTGREVFIKEGIYECQGLAVDWLGGNLYWTDDPLGRVSVARLSAPTQRRELVKIDFTHPYSIVLDPQRGVMYWSVWARAANPSGSIQTANMDGSERRTLVSDSLEWPNGLVLDMDKQILYWCDTQLNKIESLELASNKRTTVLAAPQASIKEPYGLVLVDGKLSRLQCSSSRDKIGVGAAFDAESAAPHTDSNRFFMQLVVEGDVMWSEKGSGLLRRVGAGANVTLVDGLSPPLFDIRTVSKSGRSGHNACSLDNGGCSELCLATPTGRTCACAAGRAPLATEPTRCAGVGLALR